MLKESKSKELFDLLPQCFIINITKKKNQQILIKMLCGAREVCYTFICRIMAQNY